ncbi:MAG: BON domain-containing protein [Phycisphaeraceae bacterium]
MLKSSENQGSGKMGAGSGGALLVGAALGIAAGAVLMYLLDPDRGARRRAIARDKAMSVARHAGQSVRKQALYNYGKMRGLVAKAQAPFRHDSASDDLLVQRVRSAIGRSVSHAGSIAVDAHNGAVTLRGPILAEEIDDLLAAAASVLGVRAVNNQLSIHESAGNIPGLQPG